MVLHTLELPGQKHADGEIIAQRPRRSQRRGDWDWPSPTRPTPIRRPVFPPDPFPQRGFKILSPVREFRGSLLPSSAQNFPLPT
jgi:hypothetical protein